PPTNPYPLSLHDALPISPATTAGTTWRSPSGTPGTPNGRCGGSAHAPKPSPRHGCAPPCTTAPPRSPPSTGTHRNGEGRIQGLRSEEHTSELQSRENLVC